MDSFSFLQHPVHQRSLEILQRCKEEKYSKAANPQTQCCHIYLEMEIKSIYEGGMEIV